MKWSRLAALAAAVSAMLVMATSCANIGTPSGGARDEDPPLMVSASPAPGSVNVDRRKIVINFNELINVKDAFSKVVTSPTSRSVPRVSSLGRRVMVEFDSLQPDVTYTIDFADAIEDNNEGNKLQGFSYSFATGPTLDTLRISGRVLSARGLEPQQGMLVGVHSNQADSAFTTSRLVRVAKTDDRGRFTIRGLAPGEYRVFAINDLDNDFTYSSSEEDIAFFGMVVSPTAQPAVATDSVFNPLTGQLDTVLSRPRTLYLPNDLLLRSFNSGVRTQYLAKYERLDSTRVFLKFNAPLDSLPPLSVVGRPDIKSIGVLEASPRLDSLVYWLHPELMRTDSLTIATTYLRPDSTQRLTAFNDTLQFFTKRVNVKPKKNDKKKISAQDSIAAITTRFNVTSGSSQDVYLPVSMEVPAPLARFDTTAVHLQVMVDTTWRHVPAEWRLSRPDSLNPRKFELDYPWEYATKYKLTIDSLAAVDIYGKPTLPLSHEFTVKEESEYCSLLFHISGLAEGESAFVELLNSNDALQRTAYVEGRDAFFPYLAPGKYYARIIFDSNGNGLYDTGNYDEQRQPEVAYYYPKAVNLKKNWDKEENWDIFATAVDMMKPTAILKNKPQTDKRARNKNSNLNNEDEDEDEYFDPTANPFDPNQKKRRSF